MFRGTCDLGEWDLLSTREEGDQVFGAIESEEQIDPIASPTRNFGLRRLTFGVAESTSND
jgi:hypothetical protein